MTKRSLGSKKSAPMNPGIDGSRSDHPSPEQFSVSAAQTGQAEPTMGPADAADYIAQMAAELAQIARTAKLDALAYFLEMARIEARTCLRRLEGRR
jgi:hypothetical protein